MYTETLYELLHKTHKRETFVFADEFSTVDRNELKKTASRIQNNAEKPLTEKFPESLRLWKEKFPQKDPIREFLDSSHYDLVSEIPFAPAGLSQEEAFFLFLGEKISNECLEREFLAALIRELAVQTNPLFEIRSSLIHKRERGYIALRGDYLFAAIDGNFIEGQLTPLLAELIRENTPNGEFSELVSELQLRGFVDSSTN